MKIDDSYIARRRFLCGMVGGGAAALGVGVGVPMAAYVGNLRQEPPPAWLQLDEPDWRLAPGQSKIVLYGRIPALLLRTPDDVLKVFVAVCTHFDCTVGYQAEENRIFCSCHEGYYDVEGRVLDGPPPRPLREFHFRSRGDNLIIALEKEDLEKAFSES